MPHVNQCPAGEFTRCLLWSPDGDEVAIAAASTVIAMVGAHKVGRYLTD
jgi:hypothetical protein